MNIVSNHNRLLRGAPVYTAGGDMWTSGLEYEDGKITGYSGSAFGPDCPCDSAAIVDSAFDKSTAWVEEQNYLTAHQDVTNLPYVQNSSLEFNGELISGISGSGFYAVSADNANYASEAEHAISATVAQEATHADSADFVATANFANSASSALNAEIATVSYVSLTALSADLVVSGWEHDEDGHITAYNDSAFVGNRYEGISPIVVNNEEMKISAESARLGVQDPLYFVEDSNSATVIGIHDSAFPTFEGTPDGKISAINGSALDAASVTEYSPGNNIDITNHVISVTGIVDNAYHANSADYVQMAVSAHSAEIAITALNAASSNSATYDSLGRKIVDTYLTAHQDVSNLPYVQNTALESNGILISAISGSGFYATSADNTFNADHANEADYVLSGWEYDENNRISAYNGSAFAGQGSTGGIEYEGVLPIVVNNVEHKISAQSAKLGVQDPLYFVEDSNTATVIGISGLPEVEGLMYESGLGLTGGQITSYNGSAYSADRAGYAVSATSANGAISSLSSNYVLSGWEKSNNKITAYNGTAFSAAGGSNPQVPVVGSGSVTISKPSTAVVISGKDYSNDISAASAYVYSLVSGNGFPASADQACQVVTANSANWGNVRTEVVGSTAQATGSNILYIVTGS